MQQNFEVRPATPDQADLAAELLHATAPPLFDHLYGYDDAFRLRIMALQWQAESSFLSHRHATAAYDRDGHLLGFELGLDHDGEAAALAGTWEVVQAHATEAQRRQIAEAADQLTYVVPFVPAGTYCVHNLAVVESTRGTGLGRTLLQGAFERARAAGYHTVCLDVTETNPAVDFYRHMGMSFVCETRLPQLIEKHGFPAIYRMVKKL